MKVLHPGRGVQGCDNEETGEVTHCKEINLIIRLSATLRALLKHLSALQRLPVSMTSRNSLSTIDPLRVRCRQSLRFLLIHAQCHCLMLCALRQKGVL